MADGSLRVVLTANARKDIVREGTFLRTNGRTRVSDRFLAAVAVRVQDLARLPEMGEPFRSQRKRDLRRMRVSSTFRHWNLFYSYDSAELRIERLLHDARTLPAAFR